MARTITTEAELASYLKSKQHPYKSLKMLSGGNANFTFAIEAEDGTWSVLKHAESFLKVSPTWHLGTERMDSEARALKLIHSVLPHDETVKEGNHRVKIPEIYSYDAENHVIHESYAGPRTLKAAYSEDPNIDVKIWGREIAHWAANLHRSTKDVDLGDVSWATNIYRHIYNGAPRIAERFGLDKTVNERINEKYGSLLAVENQNVCHGDFWCGNMILSEDGKTMTIGDWEMVRRGNGATDVGQFCAEAYLLDRFRGGKDLLNPFIAAYKEKVKTDREWAVRVTVHCVTHLGYWPVGMDWTDEAGQKKLVEDSHAILVMVEKEDWQGLRDSFLGQLYVDT